MSLWPWLSAFPVVDRHWNRVPKKPYTFAYKPEPCSIFPRNFSSLLNFGANFPPPFSRPLWPSAKKNSTHYFGPFLERWRHMHHSGAFKGHGGGGGGGKRPKKAKRKNEIFLLRSHNFSWSIFIMDERGKKATLPTISLAIDGGPYG